MVVLKRRRFTVEQYPNMAETGILAGDDRVELLDGEIVEMAPIGARHASTVDRLAHLFWSRLAGRVIVRNHDPLRLSEHSEPQPNVVLLGPRTNFYRDAAPEPPDAFLVVEVMDTSLEKDRGSSSRSTGGRAVSPGSRVPSSNSC